MTGNKRIITTKPLPSNIIWLVIILFVSLVERLLVVLFYQPVAFSDTPSYRRLAGTVLQGFANYDGTRTPGYPVFLALVGTDQRVWLAQLFLGALTTVLLFYIGWKLTEKTWFGGMIALAHTLNLGQLFFESNLLTESLTTFLLVLCVAGMLTWFLYPKSRNLWSAFGLGLIASITLLVRPLFIYMPFFSLLFIWISGRLRIHNEKDVDSPDEKIEKDPNHHPWRFGIAYLLPVVILLGGWVIFIHNQFGEWSLTTMTGYHLVQHTGNFFEYVPDEYATLRDTYIKYRDAHIAQYGTQTNAIWDAIPEMSRVSGYSFYGLSRVLTRISIQLILHHPFLFIKSAASGWWMFWRVPVYWSADGLRIPSLVKVVNIAITLQRIVLFLINLTFIFASIYFSLLEGLSALQHKQSALFIRFSKPALYIFMWFLSGTIWIASILQTLLDHGDNPRFLVPLQSLVVLWVATFILQYFIVRRASSSSSAQTPPNTLSASKYHE